MIAQRDVLELLREAARQRTRRIVGHRASVDARGAGLGPRAAEPAVVAARRRGASSDSTCCSAGRTGIRAPALRTRGSSASPPTRSSWPSARRRRMTWRPRWRGLLDRRMYRDPELAGPATHAGIDVVRAAHRLLGLILDGDAFWHLKEFTANTEAREWDIQDRLAWEKRARRSGLAPLDPRATAPLQRDPSAPTCRSAAEPPAARRSARQRRDPRRHRTGRAPAARGAGKPHLARRQRRTATRTTTRSLPLPALLAAQARPSGPGRRRRASRRVRRRAAREPAVRSAAHLVGRPVPRDPARRRRPARHRGPAPPLLRAPGPDRAGRLARAVRARRPRRRRPRRAGHRRRRRRARRSRRRGRRSAWWRTCPPRTPSRGSTTPTLALCTSEDEGTQGFSFLLSDEDGIEAAQVYLPSDPVTALHRCRPARAGRGHLGDVRALRPGRGHVVLVELGRVRGPVGRGDPSDRARPNGSAGLGGPRARRSTGPRPSLSGCARRCSHGGSSSSRSSRTRSTSSRCSSCTTSRCAPRRPSRTSASATRRWSGSRLRRPAVERRRTRRRRTAVRRGSVPPGRRRLTRLHRRVLGLLAPGEQQPGERDGAQRRRDDEAGRSADDAPPPPEVSRRR